MSIRHLAGPRRDGRDRTFVDGGALRDPGAADRGAAFARTDDVEALHGAHTYPMGAFVDLDRQRLDTHRWPHALASIVESHRTRT
jgi:hypothetical protein